MYVLDFALHDDAKMVFTHLMSQQGFLWGPPLCGMAPNF
jgi:hypothetical protein